jgi:hypothetical protein
MKKSILIFVGWLTLLSFRAAAQPDKVVLRSTEILTGKVLRIDSVGLRLRRTDGSENLLSLPAIDRVEAFSGRTRMVSPAASGG